MGAHGQEPELTPVQKFGEAIADRVERWMPSPFLFAIISRVHAGVLNPPGMVDASVFRGLMMQEAVLPQAVHFGVASFAMVGMVLIGFALWTERGNKVGGESAPAQGQADPAPQSDTQSDVSQDAQRIAAWGARLALVATVVQIPVGMWLVVKLSPAAQQRVLGGDWIASGLLGVSIFLSLGLLHHLATLALGVPRRKQMVAALGMMLVLITLMTGVLQRL